MKLSSKTKRRIIFLLVFVFLYCIISLVSVLMAFSVGMGRIEGYEPQGVAKAIEMVSVAISGFLMLPVTFIHDTFFMGQPLPISDWLWMILAGFLYGTIALLIWEKLFKKV